ncbi:putative ribonuclease H protein [Cardamine amara subsp. amara]|uniref:Ribonuclease H protein n=1 Tax=Cardamine amara subsp. amara TaxID=228776 RepID=A0ABD1C482_CARAN
METTSGGLDEAEYIWSISREPQLGYGRGCHARHGWSMVWSFFSQYWCMAPLAELWGVYYGLYIVWGRRVTRLELEVDSKLVVGFLQTEISDSHPLSFMVRLCHGVLSRDWIVQISHVYREANCLAAGLANYAFTLPLGFHLLESTPPIVEVLVEDDGRRNVFPRHIRI